MKANVKKSLKSKLLLAMALIMSTTVFSGIALLNASAAEDTEEITITIDKTTNIASEGFEMEDGASVRIKTNEAGIRWTVNVSEDFQTYLTNTYPDETPAYGTLVTSVNVLGENKTVLDVVYENKVALECRDLPGSLNQGVYTGAIILGGSDWAGLTAAQKAAWSETELVARAYVKVGETVIYAQADDITRSMRGVAAQAKVDGETSTVLDQYVGTFTKTATESVGDYVADNKKGEIKVEGVANGNYTAYVNARKIGEVTVANQVATLSDIDGLKLGVEYSLNLFDEQANVVATPFFSVTKVITTAEELYETFKNNSSCTAAKEVTKMTNVFDGYYVLGGDIDCTGYLFNHNGYSDNGFSANDKGLGLTGTFDGRGYEVKNMTFGEAADFTWPNTDTSIKNFAYTLFGFIGATGTVKDVAFTNIEYKIPSEVTLGRCSLLGNAVYGTVENVYVQVNSSNCARTDGLGTYAANSSVLKNVIVKMNAENQYSFFNRMPDSTNYADGSKWSNVYVVSSLELSQDKASITNVSRYDTALPTSNDYKAFEAESVWKLVDGVPVWHTYIPVKTSTYVVDLDDEKTALSKNDLVGLFGSETATLVKAESKTNGYTVSVNDGALAVTKDSDSIAWKGETITVAFYTADECIEATVRLCTEVIETAKELYETFKNNSSCTEARNVTKMTNVFDGYYVLGGDIDCTGYLFNHNGYSDNGFSANDKGLGLTGTFDGRGYEVKNMTFGEVADFTWPNTDTSIKNFAYTLFGFIGATGTVKDVAFTNIVYDIPSEVTLGRCSLLGNAVYGTVENVYVQVNSSNCARTDGLGTYAANSSVLKNVIVKMNAENQYSLFNRMPDSTNYADGSKWSNVYVVSSLELSQDKASITNVTRYETALPTSNDYSAFEEGRVWKFVGGVPVWHTLANE